MSAAKSSGPYACGIDDLRYRRCSTAVESQSGHVNRKRAVCAEASTLLVIISIYYFAARVNGANRATPGKIGRGSGISAARCRVTCGRKSTISSNPGRRSCCHAFKHKETKGTNDCDCLTHLRAFVRQPVSARGRRASPLRICLRFVGTDSIESRLRAGTFFSLPHSPRLSYWARASNRNNDQSVPASDSKFGISSPLFCGDITCPRPSAVLQRNCVNPAV